MSEANPEMNVRPAGSRRWIRWGKFAFQAVILAVVSWGLWRTVSDAHGDLTKRGVDIWKLDYRFLSLAGLLYFLGLLPCSYFWHRVMGALRQHVPRLDAVSAYFVSQLGKYVPGKVMVLVLRTAMVRQYGVNKTLTVASIFVETLTMMSVGAMFGALLLPFTVAADAWMLGFAVIAATVVGAPTLPPVFLQVVKLTKLHRLHPEIDQYLAGLNWHILWPGWLAIAVGWVATGLSLWAVLNALPGNSTTPTLHDLPILIACVTLSTVAGFVSGLPAGLGARELVMLQLVMPHFGETVAILSAIVHRCVMLVTDLVAAGLLYGMVRLMGGSGSPAQPSHPAPLASHALSPYPDAPSPTAPAEGKGENAEEK